MACMALTRRLRKTWLTCTCDAATRGKFALPLLDRDVPALEPAPDHFEGRAEGLVDVDLIDGGPVQAGEAAEIVHDLGHPPDPCRVLPRILSRFSLI